METKIIETPVDKIKVELKCWLTGRDRRAIDSIFYGDLEIGIKGNAPEIGGIKGGLYNKAQDKAIEIMVVSVNGNNEDVLNKVLDMKDEDFNFVLAEVDKITKKKID
jgi:hypothetical protein